MYLRFVNSADSNGYIGYQSSAMTLWTANVERMRIDSSGNVGIGTSSPAYRLDVANASASHLVARFTQNNTSYNTDVVWVNANNTVSDTIISKRNDGDFWLYQSGANPIVAFTSGTERMRIDSSGNLLVGTASAPASGSGGAGFIASTNSRRVLITSTSSTATNRLVEFENPNGTVGNIATSGSGTSYVTTSDYRLKENIAPMTGALAKVQQLKPVTYKWKVDGSDGQGFIAHELQAVVPECVNGEKDEVNAEGNPVYQGIDTSFLVATLTAAIQEQQAMIETLTTRLNALEGK
jgi:hypothetical protein